MRRYTVDIDGTPFTIDVEETAADRFRVMVGGQVFEATLASDEDLPGAVIAPGLPLPEPAVAHPELVAPPPPASGDPDAVAPGRRADAGTHPSSPAAPAVPPRTPVGTPGIARAGGRADVLAAPMPGVILEVHVKPGDTLRRGDPVLVLEAMKMRNTIRAPHAGVVTSVEVEAGQPVGPGDPLVRLGAAPG